MLEIKGINVYYGEVQVLHHLAFLVKEGQTVSLLGSNGAGKTTTLKTISGILRPKVGEIFLEGKRLDQVHPSSVISMGISHVPEGRRLFPQMTVEENLMMGAFEKSLWRTRKESIRHVYGLFPRLEERKGQQSGTLSGGEQQMVAIGRALMSKPKMLMLDEPSLGLAPNIVESIFELLKELNRKGMTILLVEQNAHMALQISDYAYVVENGKIVLGGKADELMDNVYVKQAYLGL